MARISPEREFAEWLAGQVVEPVKASHIKHDLYRFEMQSLTITYSKSSKKWVVVTFYDGSSFVGADERLSFAIYNCKLSVGSSQEHIRKLLSSIDCTDEYGGYPNKPIGKFLKEVHMKEIYRDRYKAAVTQNADDGMVFSAKNVPEFVQLLGLQHEGAILYSEVQAILEVINWFELAYEQSGTLLWLGQCMQHPQ